MTLDAMMQEAPARIRALPRDNRGYPIPWFVDPTPPVDFRVVRGDGVVSALTRSICWICGHPLGQYRVFVVGPVGFIQRISNEPACHAECAEFATRVCPFIANSRMQRNPAEYSKKTYDLGAENPFHDANPGIYLLHTVKGKDATPRVANGAQILKLPEPLRVSWHKERRMATREECLSALDRGRDRLISTFPQMTSRFQSMYNASVRWVPIDDSGVRE